MNFNEKLYNAVKSEDVDTIIQELHPLIYKFIIQSRSSDKENLEQELTIELYESYKKIALNNNTRFAEYIKNLNLE